MNFLQNLRPLTVAVVLVVAPSVARAAALKVVDVGAPAINCVFNATCAITVNDSVGAIQLPGISGTARLQSRSFVGVAGTPAAGKHGFLYRLDLTQAVGVGSIPCISTLKLDFGPVTKLPYSDGKSGGPVAEVFVVTKGGLGSVGIASADRVGNVTTFTFSKPVCAGASPAKGVTSFFFGMTGPKAPKPTVGQVQVVGGPLLSVQARVPTH